jgi:hypothetical protein
MEAALQRSMASRAAREAEGEAARKARITRSLVHGYEGAAAQAAGQPPDPEAGPFLSVPPQEAVNFFVDLIARLDSDEGAARHLGLTSAQVAAARNAAEDSRFARVMEHARLSDREKRRLAKSRSKARKR